MWYTPTSLFTRASTKGLKAKASFLISVNSLTVAVVPLGNDKQGLLSARGVSHVGTTPRILGGVIAGPGSVTELWLATAKQCDPSTFAGLKFKNVILLVYFRC